MSIITSLYPNSHAVLDIYKDKLSSRVKTLAQILNTYGYRTAWFAYLHDPQLNPAVGFGWGFDDLNEPDGCIFLPEEQKRKLCNWLESNKDKKFFLNFHTYKVHDPYLPSPKYKQRFTNIKSMDGIIENEEQYCFGSVHQVMQDKKLAVEFIGEDLYNQFMAAGLLNGSRKQIEDFFVSRKKEDKLYRIQNETYWRGIKFSDNLVNAYVQVLYDADILEFDEEVIGPESFHIEKKQTKP